MVRATSRAPSVGQSSVARIKNRRKKAYKVQLQPIKTKKKKLVIHDIHGSAKPLPGYTFLPVGYGELAERCKEQSRQQGVEVAVVSAGRKTTVLDPQKLTHHVHRVGYHFRSDIFDKACNDLGYRAVNGKLVRETGFDPESRFEQALVRYGPRLDVIDLSKDADEESTKVKKYIRELFPKIPDEDLDEIYKRAWEQGTSTVGNASNLSLSRQVQLATIARIRHTYTDYDKLLKLVSWKEARQIVEPMSLTKLIEWRGEQDDDAQDFEEILRETIVIDDDDDEDDDDDYGDEAIEISDTDTNGVTSDGEGSNTSLEILQQTIAPTDLNMDIENKAREACRIAAPVRRPANRALPAAMQTRWNDAVMRQRAADKVSSHHRPGGQISVPPDRLGHVPHQVVSDRVEYVRVEGPEFNRDSRNQAGTRTLPAGYGHHAAAIQQQPAVPVPRYPTAPRSSVVHRSQDHAPFSGHPGDRTVYPVTHASARPVSRIDHASASGSRYGDRISYTGPPPFSYRAEQLPSHANDYRATAQRHVYGPTTNHKDANRPPVEPRPQMPRHISDHTGDMQDHIEILKPEDYPLPSREIPPNGQQPSHAYHGDYERRDAARLHPEPRLPARPAQHQPVFGEPAYPQMRSQTVTVRASPRPVHGAPAPVQQISLRERAPSVGQVPPEFGVPSPQRYFTNSNRRPFYLPNR